MITPEHKAIVGDKQNNNNNNNNDNKNKIQLQGTILTTCMPFTRNISYYQMCINKGNVRGRPTVLSVKKMPDDAWQH